MIDLYPFQINLIGIGITFLLLFLLFFKKIDFLSILMLTSIFINIPIFNYLPWTFGFQIFFLFSIIFILLSFKNILYGLKDKNFLILTTLLLIFIFLVSTSLFLAYKNKYNELVLQPSDNPNFSYYKISQFSRLNITQFLYLLFYLALFLSVITSKFDIYRSFKYFLFGSNINFIFQIFELLLHILKKSLPSYLNNLSFLNETIQILYLKDLNIYRFSGLIPSSSMLGIYLSIALFLSLFFKGIFKNNHLRYLQIFIIFLSFFFSMSSTFILGSLLIFLIYFYNSKKYITLLPIFILILILFYLFNRQTTEIRMQIFLTSINIFLKHPFLGIGWGSHFADFFSSLLANTGILGFLSFLSIFIFMIAKTLKSKNEIIYNLMNLGLLGLFLTGIIWNGININILWIILGIWGREVIFKNA
jgi:hypothetical protein